MRSLSTDPLYSKSQPPVRTEQSPTIFGDDVIMLFGVQTARSVEK